MTRHTALVATLLCVAGSVCPSAQRSTNSLPVASGRPVVATVNDQAISLAGLLSELGPGADRARLEGGQATVDELNLLDRLIAVELVAQEGAAMGLDEIPEIRKEVEVSSRAILREVLVDHLAKDLAPDPAAVEQVYKSLVREFRTASLSFKDEASARKAREEIAGGASFDSVSSRAVAADQATAGTDDGYHQLDEYLPQIAEALADLQVGQVSEALRGPTGYLLVKIVDIRYPEDPDARAEARGRVIDRERQALLQAKDESLRKEYVSVNNELLSAVNYEAAEPGVDALSKDKRSIAEFKGGDPITVGDLTEYLQLQSFHGASAAGQLKRMNESKEAAFQAMVSRRLLNTAAHRLELDKSDAYLDKVRTYQNSLVFAEFVRKVVVPDSKLTEAEVKRYYEDHTADYSSPKMVRLRSLAFGDRHAAEEAVGKLRGGADYAWVSATAEGQLAAGREGVLRFDNRPVTADSLPAGMEQALAEARAGDARLFVAPDGVFYALLIGEVISPTPRPYADVRDEISRKVYQEKLKKNLDDYVAKLRAVSKVEVYLKRMG